MPFADPWDETTPTDANLASEGDDRIREMKRALTQRLGPLFTNWPDGAPDDLLLFDPTKLPDTVPEVTVGLLADRPNPPTVENQLYFTTDTDQIFQAVDNGGLAWVERKPAQGEQAIVVISAAESRFQVDEDDTDAMRVKNAIAYAAQAEAAVKVVYIPRSMWGYIADPEYGTIVFDPAVFMAREGGLWGMYDPVAYGLDLTGAVSSEDAIDKAFEHAAAAATSNFKAVAFTVPGNYNWAGAVDQRSCGVFIGEDVEFTGAGTLGGTRAWRIPADDYLPDTVLFFDNALAAGSRVVEQAAVKQLSMRIRGQSTGGGQLVIAFTGEALLADFPLNKMVTLVTRQIHRVGVTGGDTGSDGYGVTVDTGANTITFSGLAVTEQMEFNIVATFIA